MCFYVYIYVYPVGGTCPLGLKYDRIYNNFEPCKQYQKNIGVKYTPNGYKLLKLDHKLKKRLVDFWELNKNLKTPEPSIKEIKNTVKPDNQHITNLLILYNKWNTYQHMA